MLGKKVKFQNQNIKLIEKTNTKNNQLKTTTTTTKKTSNNNEKNVQRFIATDGSDIFMQDTSVQKCTEDIEIEKRPFRPNEKSDFTYFLDVVPAIRSGLERYIMVYGMESVITYI